MSAEGSPIVGRECAEEEPALRPWRLVPTRSERVLVATACGSWTLTALMLAAAWRGRRFRGRRGRVLAGAALGSHVTSGAVIALQLANNRFFDRINLQTAPADAAPEQRLEQTLQYLHTRRVPYDPARIESPLHRLVARLESRSPFHVSTRTAILAGHDLVGPCGALSRALVVLLNRAGISARRAHLYDRQGVPLHTVVEVHLGGRWRVADPSYRQVWRRHDDGELATVEEIAADPALFSSVRTTDPNYPLDLYTYNSVYRLRLEKIPALKTLRELLRTWISDERLRSIPTPYAYERPDFLLAIALLASAAAALTFTRRSSGR